MAERTATHEYDVALSFAGEDRELAKTLAKLLYRRGVNVFYDEFEQASLWGKDLYQHLQKVYRDSAKFCVIFVSQAYNDKLWTRHELKQAQARAFQDNKEYILPILTDDTELTGLNPTIGYIDLRTSGLDAVAELLIEKLAENSGWDTWPETKTNINEFSPRLRTGLDTAISLACSHVVRLFPDERCYSLGNIALMRQAFQDIKTEPGLDIELICMNDIGEFIYTLGIASSAGPFLASGIREKGFLNGI